MHVEIAEILPTELPDLLALYHFLNPDDPELEVDERLLRHWNAIFADPSLIYVVARVDGQIVSACNLTVIPNLTRCARPYGLIENVVTHPDYRNRGLGTAVLRLALEKAWGANCYKVMLFTGSKREETLRFYEGAGFTRGHKTGFIARPPSGVS